jgi:hypothetical protein
MSIFERFFRQAHEKSAVNTLCIASIFECAWREKSKKAAFHALRTGS